MSLIATDPSGANATATFTLTVTPVPDAPIFVAQENTSVNEDEILTLTLAATDADDDPLTYSVGAVSNVVAEVTGTTLTLAPELNFNGPRDITVTVDDGTNLNDQQTFTLTVNPVNDDPVVALIEPQTMNEDGTLDVTIQASDVDDPTLTYTSFTTEPNLSLAVTDNIVSITPAQDWNGVGDVSVVATDAEGASHTRTFALTVQPVEDSPVITQVTSQTVEEDGTVTVALSASDVDAGDTQTFTVATVENVTAEISTEGSSVVLTPEADFFGDRSVTVTVTDLSLIHI